ncbi:MAG: helix-turn-helix domain-containing protein [Candidatus Pacearchaeota archaeon]
MSYGLRIRTFRKLKGFTQQDVADRINVTQSTYSRIETDDHNASVEELKKIAEALDVSLGDLISSEPLVINNHASNHGAQGKIEHFYGDNKETYEKLLTTMNQQIEQMQLLIKLLSKKE